MGGAGLRRSLIKRSHVEAADGFSGRLMGGPEVAPTILGDVAITSRAGGWWRGGHRGRGMSPFSQHHSGFWLGGGEGLPGIGDGREVPVKAQRPE